MLFGDWVGRDVGWHGCFGAVDGYVLEGCGEGLGVAEDTVLGCVGGDRGVGVRGLEIG